MRHGIGIGILPFEFLRSLFQHKCDAAFLRDLRPAWYQLSVDGIAADVVGLAQWLQARRRGFARAITLGNSRGDGSAERLYERLAGFELSIAFSSQTTIDADALATLDDRRWQRPIEQVYAQAAES